MKGHSGTGLKIGLAGCGTIGTRIAQAIDNKEVCACLAGITDIQRQKAEELTRKLTTQRPEILDLKGIFEASDLVVEAASGDSVPEVLLFGLQYKKDCMIMSIGGILGNEGFISKAQENGINIYCPSGAIAGLDAVAAASVGRVDLVRLTTIKPPGGLKGAPYVTERGIDLDKLESEQIIFEGNALEAVKAFPKNINVAAALSLAGVGPSDTKIRIVADPRAIRNTHQIEVEGEFGRLMTITENLPSPFNPRTSYLAALSAVSCLRKITSPLKMGG
ncbi:aspartate dehydrogenase [bacterium]|nr:aspartate dehydrogenase [bacterium]